MERRRQPVTSRYRLAPADLAAVAWRVAIRFGLLREVARHAPAGGAVLEAHPLASLALEAARLALHTGGRLAAVPVPPEPSEPARCSRCGGPMHWRCTTHRWHRWQCHRCFTQVGGAGLVHIPHDPALLAARVDAWLYGGAVARRVLESRST